MQVKITAQWGATSFFDAGERQLELKWENHTIPYKGNVIRLFSFLKTAILPREKFVYDGKETNVFEFIDNEQEWRVQKVSWERQGNELVGHVLVTDTYDASEE